ncbi:MAG: hypothetical protein Q9211_003392, partial [Gyalolechia sp. 1 TL-2023]
MDSRPLRNVEYRSNDMEKLSEVQFLCVVDLVQTLEHSPPETSVMLAGVDLEIHIFQLFGQPRVYLEYERPDQDEDTPEMDRLRAHVTALPHIELQGLWESLIFDDPLHTRLLRFLLRM